jgi:hypothetical protein
MLSQINSSAVSGIDAYAVEIEVNAGHGEPKVVVVGLPDAAVKESSDPSGRLLLTLASVRQWGTPPLILLPPI